MAKETLTIRRLSVRAVEVPMQRPLVTSGGTVKIAPLVLIDLEVDQGITGRSYSFAYTSAALGGLARVTQDLGALLVGETLAPLALEAKLRASLRLLGVQGLTGMALAGLDMAAWDALAKAAGQPLVRLLGAAPRPLPAYNSKGLGIIGAAAAAREAEELLAEGFSAIKLRLGYPSLAQDLEVAAAVRKAIGSEPLIMSDYNQSLSVSEAEQRARGLGDAGLLWIEEPVRHDDYAGHARVRAASAIAIQTGENCWGPTEIGKALAAGASDLIMLDAVKVGGVSGWLRAAALAQDAGVPVSSHLFPEVSAHLLCATPGAHWLEFVDWASPILAEPCKISDGSLAPSETPGIGVAWDEDAVSRYAV